MNSKAIFQCCLYLCAVIPPFFIRRWIPLFWLISRVIAPHGFIMWGLKTLMQQFQLSTAGIISNCLSLFRQLSLSIFVLHRYPPSDVHFISSLLCSRKRRPLKGFSGFPFIFSYPSKWSCTDVRLECKQHPVTSRLACNLHWMMSFSSSPLCSAIKHSCTQFSW